MSKRGSDLGAVAVGLLLLLPSVAVAAGAALPTAAWTDLVTAGIRQLEYELSLRPDGGWSAPNRAHNLRAIWHEDALVVTPRLDSSAWSLSYRLIAVGRSGGRLDSVGAAHTEQVADGRLTWGHDGIDQWYHNDARGIEQGFVLHAPPAGDRQASVVIDGTLHGLQPYPSDDGQSVLLRTAGGKDALRLRDLIVTDAEGSRLHACLEVIPGRLRVVIDDLRAVYPITVDPLLTSPTWMVDVDNREAAFGTSVATAGDVDGDGFADVIIGAPTFDRGAVDSGRAFVFHGSRTGLALIPAWSAAGEQATTEFGQVVATAGDVNGDGFADVVVGAPYYDGPELDEGRVYVFHGSPTGLDASPAWTAESDQAGSAFATTAGTAGDVDGDGFDDVIVGAYLFDGDQFGEGRAFVFHGSPSGLEATARWTAESDQSGSRFGNSVATAGDVDGDGFADVVIGARFFENGELAEGRAFVYHGSATGLARTHSWTAEVNQRFAYFGAAVASAGDTDGDGFGDVLIGGDGFQGGGSTRGGVVLFRGSPSGLEATPAWTVISSQDNVRFGQAVACAGDVDDDGFADVLIGASGFSNGQAGEGGVFLYRGAASGLETTPSWTAEGDQNLAGFGYMVGAAGDVDGDGFSDVIVGAPDFDNGETDEGVAFVFHGSASGLAAAPTWAIEGDQFDAELGAAVGVAGDVNGDGYSDVIVGAPHFDNGVSDEGAAFVYHGSAAGLVGGPAWTGSSGQSGARFGAAIATAGDVDGDGYSDVIVGAPGFSNGLLSEGVAFVFHGAPGGLGPAPAWTLEGNQDGANLGAAVGSAGDVDGDGFGDVIIGAPLFDNGEFNEGRAVVVRGSGSGLAATPSWMVESDQVQASFGAAVGTAGDVNADGYSDVIVGAYLFDNGEANEGRAFVYHGSDGGLATAPAWTAESDQASAFFGQAVGTAGDVDGDGISDVIVGAPNYSNDQPIEGRAYVYHGTLAGLAAAPGWIVEGDQDNAQLGSAVGFAGDVNGDGFADVIVGAALYTNRQPNEGRALVYHGSAGGLPTLPSWTADGEQMFVNLGSAAATAGDVNGDGFADVVIGVPNFANGELGEGRAVLHYGNGGDGLERIPRQARADGSAPIDLFGRTTSATGLRLRANGRTPFGRSPVRLEWQVQALGETFDTAPLQVSAWFDSGPPGVGGSVVPLEELHAPLTGLGPFRWRLRLRSRSVIPWQSHWLSLPYNTVTETDLRTEKSQTRCDLDYADLTFPPVDPPRVGAWVYTQTCAGGDVLPTVLLAAVASGTDIDALGGSGGSLRLYQLECGCAAGILLTKNAGQVRLETY